MQTKFLQTTLNSAFIFEGCCDFGFLRGSGSAGESARPTGKSGDDPAGCPQESFRNFVGMIGSAVFPHLSRRPQATAAPPGKKKKAWDWIQELIREGVRNPGRARWEPFGKVGTTSSQLFPLSRGLPLPFILLTHDGHRPARDARYGFRTQDAGQWMEDGAQTPRAWCILVSCAPEFRRRTETSAAGVGNGEGCGWGPTSHGNWGFFA